ncbi:DNA topoisomerase, partial [Acidovorax sp. SRB_24]|nr:DNA topoisomerase [Acidovorax sp. SRB_24]
MRAAPALAADAPAPGSRLPGGLVYVDRRMPGLRRVRRGRGFGYRQPDGRWLTDAQEVERIRQLAIPPAYTEVWICPLPHGHLQATGLDARGRRQYRYHPD